jgi:hypothetical protein
MRKIVLFSVLLCLLVAPAWGAIVIKVQQVGDTNEFQVTYDVNDEPNLIRAFGLDVTIDTGGKVSDANWLKYGEPNYYIYPGSIDINTAGIVEDYGSPVCDPCGLPAGTTKPGLDSNGVSVEMGSLYVGAPNSPSRSGTLLSIFVDSANDCNIMIAGNAARTGTGSESPGVVMEDPDQSVAVEFVGARYVHGNLDFGDAPDPLVSTPGQYPTLLVNNGARHKVYGGHPMLGLLIDTEPDGLPNATATGDDLVGSAPDDEDGITSIKATGWSNGGPTVTFTVTNGPAYLNGWIDWDQNGSWGDTGEHVITDVSVPSGSGQTLTLTGAPGAVMNGGQIFSRWRISTASGLSYTGQADDGEVEDYNDVDCSCKGEVTGDGKVNASDITTIAGWIAAYGSGRPKSIQSTDTAHYKPCGDANLDGKINASDITKISGWIAAYGSGRPKSVTCPHSYN